jgi:uncharacterized membrane protein
VVDVRTEIEIQRPRHDVADYASNPDNARAWYEHIKEVSWNKAKPLEVGSRIVFGAQFLGKQLDYVYEVKELEPGERFVMATAEGPFPMETTYAWEDTADGGTKMFLRNRGQPRGFSRVTALVLVRAMRRANKNDLRRLKAVLER